MAVVVAGGGGRARTSDQPRPHWQEQRSPGVMAMPRPPRPRAAGVPVPARVAVVYYLSRNGHLEHPHFMQVALSSPEGLYLRGTYVYYLLAHGVSFCFVLSLSVP